VLPHSPPLHGAAFPIAVQPAPARPVLLRPATPTWLCRAGPLLRKGFRKRIFFAGEHTCFAYFGYMEGALQSGQIAASAVLKTASRQRQQQNA
jgi:hypothetical protein